MDNDPVSHLLTDFPLLFERDTRFYYLTWQPTLLDTGGAIVRIYGRKGVWQRVLITPYSSRIEAQAHLHRLIRRRFNHGYRLTGGRKP